MPSTPNDFSCCDLGGTCRAAGTYRPTPTEAIQVDPDLLESQLRIARIMSNGPLTDEAS